MSKILVSLPIDLLLAVDKVCKTSAYNRSEFIRHALRHLLSIKERTKKNAELGNS